MVVFIIILGALVAYFLLARKTKTVTWSGEDVSPDYDAGIKCIGQQGIPYTPSLNIPFDDPEVPARLKKPKKRKTTLARGIKPAKRKTKKRVTKRKTK
jgi:hypothetical protein